MSERQPETEPPFVRKPIFREYTDNEIPPFSFFTAKTDKPPFLVGGSWLKNAPSKSDDLQTPLPIPVSDREEMRQDLQSFGPKPSGENTEDASKIDSQTSSNISDLNESQMSNQNSNLNLDTIVKPGSMTINTTGGCRPSLKLSTILGSDHGKEGLSYFLTRQAKEKTRITQAPKSRQGSETSINLSSLQMFGTGHKGPSHHLKSLVQQIKESKHTELGDSRTNLAQPSFAAEKRGLTHQKASVIEPRAKKIKAGKKGPTHQKANTIKSKESEPEKEGLTHEKPGIVKPKITEISVSIPGCPSDEKTEFPISASRTLHRSASIASNDIRPSSQMTDIDA